MRKGLFQRLEQEIENRSGTGGLSMLDVLDLPDSMRELLNWMMRERTVKLADVAARLGEDEAKCGQVLAILVEKGLLQEVGSADQKAYRVVLAARRTHPSPAGIWQALDDKIR